MPLDSLHCVPTVDLLTHQFAATIVAKLLSLIAAAPFRTYTLHTARREKAGNRESWRRANADDVLMWHDETSDLLEVDVFHIEGTSGDLQ
jgi:hypothetical protein